MITNALTIDVEDYFQVSNFEADIRREDWPSHPSRVVQNTERVLAILDRYSVKATFYVLGYVAERYPDLVRSIDAAGHEIGSHSYWHRLVFQLTPEEFRHDLRRSREVLEGIVGKPVTSYRAPSFSINDRSLWRWIFLPRKVLLRIQASFPVAFASVKGRCQEDSRTA